jgi:hypothetical protein
MYKPSVLLPEHSSPVVCVSGEKYVVRLQVRGSARRESDLKNSKQNVGDILNLSWLVPVEGGVFEVVAPMEDLF